jgi:hypothetical protein
MSLINFYLLTVRMKDVSTVNKLSGIVGSLIFLHFYY